MPFFFTIRMCWKASYSATACTIRCFDLFTCLTLNITIGNNGNLFELDAACH